MITDIHSHFLFNVDDGAGSIEQSLKMIEQAASLDIKHLVATPHVTDFTNKESSQKFLNHFSQLQEEVSLRNIPIKISLAAELLFCSHIYDWLKFPWSTFNNNKKYLLFELPLFDLPDRVGEFIFHCRLKGITPIMAHPERYIYLHNDVDKIIGWFRQGCLMQLNAGSLIGQFGDKVAVFSKKLLKAHIFHFVASDAHDYQNRNYEVLAKSLHAAQEILTKEDVYNLFSINPEKAIAGKPISQNQIKEIPLNENWINKFFINLKKFR